MCSTILHIDESIQDLLTGIIEDLNDVLNVFVKGKNYTRHIFRMFNYITLNAFSKEIKRFHVFLLRGNNRSNCFNQGDKTVSNTFNKEDEIVSKRIWLGLWIFTKYFKYYLGQFVPDSSVVCTRLFKTGPNKPCQIIFFTAF